MTKGLQRGLTGSGWHVASGDYIDAEYNTGMRLAGTSVVSYNTGTSAYAMQAGAGSLADGTGTGSTTTVTYTTYLEAPFVTANLNLQGFAEDIGSDGGISLAAAPASGSAVLVGPSGVGFVWSAIGQRA